MVKTTRTTKFRAITKELLESFIFEIVVIYKVVEMFLPTKWSYERAKTIRLIVGSGINIPITISVYFIKRKTK